MQSSFLKPEITDESINKRADQPRQLEIHIFWKPGLLQCLNTASGQSSKSDLCMQISFCENKVISITNCTILPGISMQKHIHIHKPTHPHANTHARAPDTVWTSSSSCASYWGALMMLGSISWSMLTLRTPFSLRKDKGEVHARRQMQKIQNALQGITDSYASTKPAKIDLPLNQSCYTAWLLCKHQTCQDCL